MGRHSEYTKQTAIAICELIAGGLALKDVCEIEGMPCRAAVYKWLYQNEDFAGMYARAREERADLLADEIVAIADTEPDHNKARVRIDARKWWAAKVNPKKFGDKVTNEVVGKDGAAISHAVEVTFVGKTSDKG